MARIRQQQQQQQQQQPLSPAQLWCRFPQNSTLVWFVFLTVIAIFRTTNDCFPTLRENYRRWSIRRSRRAMRKLRTQMDILIEQERNRIIDVCFVSSIFGEDSEYADKPGDVSNVWLDPSMSIQDMETTFRFFLFTNLPNMPVSEGWTKIVKTDAELPFRRFITKSRWPKFMGWQDPLLKGCQTIFYFDGHYSVNVQTMFTIGNVATNIRNSHSGLAQVKHPQKRTALQEFSRILLKRKDIPANVEASVLWLVSQPDFDNRCTMYKNSFFGYDPHNPQFQAAAQFFWNRYVLEVDSWRDQPLWCYSLQHTGMTQPLLLTDEPHGLFHKDKLRTGHNDHQYDEHADGQPITKKKQTTDRTATTTATTTTTTTTTIRSNPTTTTTTTIQNDNDAMALTSRHLFS